MSTAQRPSNELANKSNVIPSINRLTEATAEDFRELAAILLNHADIIDGISRANEQSKFYGFHGSLAILQATFQNAQEGGFAVIDPGNGDPQQIARFSNGVWTAQEIKAPIQFYNSIITRPQTGQENTWYVIKDSGVIYLYYDGNWHPFGKNGINGASAYEIAKAVGGFVGTELEWLVSLKGEKGDPGPVAEPHTVFVDTIWNEGDSQIFTVSDSAKVTHLSVQGIGAREGIEWEKYSTTEIRVIMPLDPGNWVFITGSNVAATQDKTDVISYALSSPSADLAAGETDSFIAPYNFTLNNYFAGVAVAPGGSALVVGLKKNGTSVTSSNAIIDSGETTSLTGTAPTITTNTFLKGDLITPNIVQVGALETGKSLKIYLEITKS